MLFVPITLLGGTDEVLWIQIETESVSLGYCHMKNFFLRMIPMTMNNLYGLVALILTIPIRNLPDNFHDSKAVFLCLVTHVGICVIISALLLLIKENEEYWYRVKSHLFIMIHSVFSNVERCEFNNSLDNRKS